VAGKKLEVPDVLGKETLYRYLSISLSHTRSIQSPVSVKQIIKCYSLKDDIEKFLSQNPSLKKPEKITLLQVSPGFRKNFVT